MCNYWKQEIKAAEAANKIYEMEEKDVVQFVNYKNSLKSLKKDTDLRFKLRSGHHITLNTETICDAIETNLSTSAR